MSMGYRAPAAACAAEILLLLARSEQPLTTAEIARSVGSSRSLVFRALKELERTEMVERVDPYRYWLGVGVLEVGGAYLALADFTTIARRVMRDLAETTGEAINLGTLRGASVVYVLKEDGRQAVVTISHVGKALPANCSALGKALLAGLPWSDVERRFGRGPLRRLTDRSITDLDRLAGELERVRAAGYATEEGESVPHRCCLAVPVRMPGDRPRPAALSISCAVQEYTARRDQLIDALFAAKARLDRGADSARVLRDAAGDAGAL